MLGLPPSQPRVPQPEPQISQAQLFTFSLRDTPGTSRKAPQEGLSGRASLPILEGAGLGVGLDTAAGVQSRRFVLMEPHPFPSQDLSV